MQNLEEQTRYCKAECEEQTNQPSDEAEQEERSSDLTVDVECIEDCDDRDQNENCDQDPQPQEGLRVGDGEGCKAEHACNCCRPALEGYVLFCAYGITGALEQTSVEDLEERGVRLCGIIGDDGAILYEHEGVGERSLAVCRSNSYERCVGSLREDVACRELHLKGDAVAVRAATRNAVDRVGHRQCSVGYGYVYVCGRHGELIVGHGYVCALVGLNRQECFVAGLLRHGKRDRLACDCSGGSSGYVAVHDHVIGELLIGCVDGVNVACVCFFGELGEIVCLPCTVLACLFGNSGLYHDGRVVLNRYLEGGCTLKFNGVNDGVPFCRYVDIGNTDEVLIKANPCTRVLVSRGNGCTCGERCEGRKERLRGGEGCDVSLGVRRYNGITLSVHNKLAVDVVVNVEAAGGCGYGEGNGVGDHKLVEQVILGGVACNESLDLIDRIACLNREVQDELVSCGQVHIGGIHTNHCTVDGVGAVGEDYGYQILGCDHVIGEVRRIEPNVFFGSLCHNTGGGDQLTRACGAGVNSGCRACSVLDRSRERNLNADRSSKAFGYLRAVRENVEGIEGGVNSGCIRRILEGLGSGCCLCVVKYHVAALCVVDLCQGCVLQSEEGVAAVFDHNVERYVIRAVCTLQEDVICKIQLEEFGQVAENGQRVNAIVLGYLIRNVDIKLKVIVGCESCLQRGVCGELRLVGDRVRRLAFLHHVPRNVIAIDYVRVEGGNGDQTQDLGNFVRMVCERVAGLHRDHTQKVAVHVIEIYVDHVTVRVNDRVGSGHGENLNAVFIGPSRELVARDLGIILENAQIRANGQEYLVEDSVTLAVHIGDAVDIGCTNGQVKTQLDLACANVLKNEVDRLFGEIYAIGYLAQELFHERLCIHGGGTLFGKHTVELIGFGEGAVEELLGQICSNKLDVVSYLIIKLLVVSRLFKRLIKQLVNRVGFEDREDIHAELGFDHVSDRFGDRLILYAINDRLSGDLAQINVELRGNLIQDLLNRTDLLSAINDRVNLARDRVNVLHHVNAGLVCDDLADTLEAGNAGRVVNEVVKGEIGEIVAGLIGNHLESGLHVTDVLEGFEKLGGLDQINDRQQLLQGERVNKCQRAIALNVCDVEDLLLELLGDLLGIKHGCKQLSCGAGESYVKGENTVCELQFINVGLDQLLSGNDRVLQTAQVALYHEFNGEILRLLRGGAVYGVDQTEIKRDQLAILHIDKLVNRGDCGENCLYKVFGVEREHLGACVLSCHLIAIEGNLVDVEHQLVEHGGDNGLDHRGEINLFQDIDDLVAVELRNQNLEIHNLQKSLEGNVVDQSIKMNISIKNLAVCVDLFDHSVEVQLVNELGNVNASESLAHAADSLDDHVERIIVEDQELLEVSHGPALNTGFDLLGRYGEQIRCAQLAVAEHSNHVNKAKADCSFHASAYTEGSEIPRTVNPIRSLEHHLVAGMRLLHLCNECFDLRIVCIAVEGFGICGTKLLQIGQHFVLINDNAAEQKIALAHRRIAVQKALDRKFDHCGQIEHTRDLLGSLGCKIRLEHVEIHLCEQSRAVGVLEQQALGNVALVNQLLDLQILLQILNGRKKSRKTCRIGGCHHGVDVHVGLQRVKADGVDDVVNLGFDQVDPSVVRDQLKDLLGGDQLLERIQIDRLLIPKVADQIDGDPVLLQDVGKRTAVHRDRHGGGGTVRFGIHLKPCIRDRAERQSRYQQQYGEDDGKNFVKHLHNKTSLCSDSAHWR